MHHIDSQDWVKRSTEFQGHIFRSTGRRSRFPRRELAEARSKWKQVVKHSPVPGDRNSIPTQGFLSLQMQGSRTGFHTLPESSSIIRTTMAK